MEGKRPISTTSGTSATTAGPASKTGEPIMLGTHKRPRPNDDEAIDDDNSKCSTATSTSPPTTPGTPPQSVVHQQFQPSSTEGEMGDVIIDNINKNSCTSFPACNNSASGKVTSAPEKLEYSAGKNPSTSTTATSEVTTTTSFMKSDLLFGSASNGVGSGLLETSSGNASSSNNSGPEVSGGFASISPSPSSSSPSLSAAAAKLLQRKPQQAKSVELEIAPTTGGSFTFVIDPNESIEGFKKAIGKKLKVGKEHICLLHRDRLLESSKRIRDYGLADGSRVSLVPSVETGLLTQRPEQSVLEALEGLNESQVGDFLSGKSPLNLTMRLGDHVMLIQLQLSKGNKSSSSGHHSKASSSSSSSATTTTAATAASVPTSTTSTSATDPLPTPSSSSPSVPSSSAAAASGQVHHFSRRSQNEVFRSTTTTTTSSTAAHEASSEACTESKKVSSTETFPTAATATPTPAATTLTYEHDRLNTLAEASRNLSNTLKKLSSHVIKEDDDSITTHMQHHGKGVYSGTFSGTLNPALQDGLGKPKKHVSTIIHILNDLLGGMDPGKCTHISSTTSSVRSTTTSPVSPGSSLSTDLHNKRRQLRRKQAENPHYHHHRKSDGSSSSSSKGTSSSSPGSSSHHLGESDPSMKKSKLVSSPTLSGKGQQHYSHSSNFTRVQELLESDHHYHRCNKQGCSSSACSPSSSTGSSSTSQLYTGSREKENEQLKLKMERLKESLRLRKEKILLRSSRMKGISATGRPDMGSVGPETNNADVVSTPAS